MDSNRIKNLATGARVALREEVQARLSKVLEQGSTERLEHPRHVARIEKDIDKHGEDAVIERAAYTWFNRLCALRFMDARGYTPVGIVTPRSGSTQPAVLADAMQDVYDPELCEENTGVIRLVKDRVSSLLSGATPSDNPTEAVYAELLAAVCDLYARPMPYLFKEDVASTLLMPRGLLAEGSILRKIVEDMDDAACESVEVMGWLYQYYIAERKDEVFASKAKRKAEDIAPATQLFTPRWIVQYMVENSLGRIWMLNNPGSPLRDEMPYYIEGEAPAEYLRVASAKDLTVLDPACGSGHILVYAFELLYKMYEEEGWLPEDIPAMILQNNLFGFEIDQRAAELAMFALEMIAREKDPAFFEKAIDAKVTVLEPVRFSEGELECAGLLAEREDLLAEFDHLDEIGSLLCPDVSDVIVIDNAIANLEDQGGMFADSTLKKLKRMRETVEKLSQEFSCVVANPPYMATSSLEAWASKWVKDNYPDEKADLFSAFIVRNLLFARQDGTLGFMSPYVWMFISSYEHLRHRLIDEHFITSLVQLEYSGFAGATVPICTFTLQKSLFCDTKGSYIRLSDFVGSDNQAPKTLEAIQNPDCGWLYRATQQDFKLIPGSPIAYWVSRHALDAFSTMKTIGDTFKPAVGIQTGDNNTFLRLWWEVAHKSIGFHGLGNEKWYPHNKGGDFRKWYGNQAYLINWENDGYEIKNFFDDKGKLRSRPQNLSNTFKTSISWSMVTSGDFSVREYPNTFTANVAGVSIYPDHGEIAYVGAFLNSSLANYYVKAINPTLNSNSGDIERIPFDSAFRPKKVELLYAQNTSLSRADWDAFEASWDFKHHPLIPAVGENNIYLGDMFAIWKTECQERFDVLKSNEEELNRIFVEIYDMQNEVPIEVPNDKVSVRLADLQRDIKSLISYAIGCIMGRYSTEKDGLILANRGSTVSDFLEKVPDATLVIDSNDGTDYPLDYDGILPILDAEWFVDDLVTQIRDWLSQVYGSDTLAENLDFIESALGKDLRTYLVKDFYADHIKTYQKRPIYWLFSSPKGSFSCLIYIHRYNESTVGQILTGYLRPYIEKLNGTIATLDASTRAADHTQADKYRAIVQELLDWERDVIYPLAQERVSIDLDDGVKVNYNKFPHALRKVSGLSEWK